MTVRYKSRVRNNVYKILFHFCFKKKEGEKNLEGSTISSG